MTPSVARHRHHARRHRTGRAVSGSPALMVRLGSGVAFAAAAYYMVVRLYAWATGKQGWTDRSPVGIAIFGTIWLALAGAAGAASLQFMQPWGKARLHGKVSAEVPAETTPVTSEVRRGSKRWWRAAGLVAGLGALAPVYVGIYQPGLVVGGDWGAWAFQPQADQLFPFPSVWSFSNLGASNLPGTSTYMLESAAGLLGRMGIGYGEAERILFYLPVLLLGYFGMYFLARRVVGGEVLPVASAIFLMVSVPIIAFEVGGWFTILAGGVLLPWLVLASERYLEQPTFPRAAMVGSLLGLAAWYDPRNLYLDGIGLLLYLIAALLGQGRREVLRTLTRPQVLVIPVTTAVMQLQWLVPYAAGLRTNIPSSYFTAASASTFSFNSLGDGLSAFNYAWPALKTGVPQVVPVLWAAIPLAVGLAVLGALPSRLARFAVASYLLYAALAAGAEAPFGQVYIWLFENVPGVDLYRDTSVYLVPGTIAATLCAAVAIRTNAPSIVDCVRGRRVLHQSIGVGMVRVALGGGIALAMLALSLSTVATVEGFRARGDLTASALPARYRNLNSYLAHAPSGSALWIPSTSGFALRGVATHPNVSAAVVGSQLSIPTPRGSLPAQWTASHALLSAALRLYHIRYIVLRTGRNAYSGASAASLSGLPTRFISPLVKSLCGGGCRRFGSLELVDAAPSNGGIVSVQSAVASNQLRTMHRGGPTAAQLGARRRSPAGLRTGSAKASLTPECLVSTTFGGHHGHAWGVVGNGDNFAGLTSVRSGVGEQLTPTHDLRLTVGSGAATVLQNLAHCMPLLRTSLWLVTARYRNLRGDYFQLSIGGRRAATGACNLPSGRGWTTSTCLIGTEAAPSATGSAPSRLDLAVSLYPAVNTRRPYAQTSSAFIHTVSVHRLDPGALASELSMHGAEITPTAAVNHLSPIVATLQKLWGSGAVGWGRALEVVAHKASGVDRWTLRAKPRVGPHLVVLWQDYNAYWRLTDSRPGAVLEHVVVNGWANGWIVSQMGGTGLRLTVAFTGQSDLELGMTLELGALLLIGLAFFASVLFKRRRGALLKQSTLMTVEGRPGPFRRITQRLRRPPE